MKNLKSFKQLFESKWAHDTLIDSGLETESEEIKKIHNKKDLEDYLDNRNLGNKERNMIIGYWNMCVSTGEIEIKDREESNDDNTEFYDKFLKK
jgi:hypothetical protein